MRLTPLDSLRVICEFIIVCGHLAGSTPYNELWVSMILRDLMSFFFILSGFVSMYTHHDPDHFATWPQVYKFWRKKFVENYPIYLLICAINLIRVYAVNDWRVIYQQDHLPTDHWFPHTCVALDIVLLGSFFYCMDVEGLIYDAGWYLQILFAFWFVFPLIHTRIIWLFKPSSRLNIWVKLGILACIGNSWYVLTVWIPHFNGQRLVYTRFFEFIIGNGVYFTLSQCPPRTSVFLLAIFTLGLFYMLARFVFVHIPWWCPNPEESCIPMTTSNIWGRFSMVWAICISYIANDCITSTKSWFLSLLYYRFFQDMAHFSLQLYMTHIAFARIFQYLKETWGMYLFSNLVEVVLVYYWAYLVKRHVHPWLVALAEWIWPAAVLIESNNKPLDDNNNNKPLDNNNNNESNPTMGV